MSELDLLMPMAGRGSRFAKVGMLEPKPLLELEGKPFFWWAVESVRRVASVREMVFVVLQEHIEEWRIDERIRAYYPQARIVAIPEVTSGSAETALVAANALTDASVPIAVNDCDHAFVVGRLDAKIDSLVSGEQAGTLMTFRANSPNYSYVELSPQGEVKGTVEKKVVSDFAITGCYLFSSAALYREQYAKYLSACPYDELFVSGIYNEMIREGMKVGYEVLEEHFAFGTPEEYEAVRSRVRERISGWSGR